MIFQARNEIIKVQIVAQEQLYSIPKYSKLKWEVYVIERYAQLKWYRKHKERNIIIFSDRQIAIPAFASYNVNTTFLISKRFHCLSYSKLEYTKPEYTAMSRQQSFQVPFRWSIVIGIWKEEEVLFKPKRIKTIKKKFFFGAYREI